MKMRKQNIRKIFIKNYRNNIATLIANKGGIVTKSIINFKGKTPFIVLIVPLEHSDKAVQVLNDIKETPDGMISLINNELSCPSYTVDIYFMFQENYIVSSHEGERIY